CAGVAINDSIVVLAALQSQTTGDRQITQSVEIAVFRSTRHVLTTTITTIAGFMPLLLLGSDFWSPLAICIVSGIVGATLLALYFVPCAYLLIHQHKFFSPKNQ
ncbi:MAG: efflux RND transporter permease subunit, partial [Cyanobacteria bacterium J06600_6]